MSKIKKAIIPAAGLGTRLRPLTYGVPKELLVIKNKPMIHYSLEECISAGIENIAVVINKGKNGIREYLENVLSAVVNFEFIYQEEATGIADAVLLADDFVGEDPFFILFTDVIFQGEQNPLIELGKCYNKYKAPCAALISSKGPNHQIGTSYGFIEYDACNENVVRINRLYGKGSQKRSSFKTTGRAIWSRKVLDYLRYNKIKDNLGEYSEVPALQKYIKENEFYGVKLISAAYDCGTLDGFKFANSHYDGESSDRLVRKNKIEISVVIAVFNEEEVLHKLNQRLISVLESISKDYEVIFVDDGSKDNSWKIVEDLCKENQNVRGIKFTRNFGQHVAITAGLDHAEGDFIVLMDADLQDQPEEIPKMLEKCKDGFEIVYAIRRTRSDSATKKALSKGFYFVFNKLSSFKLRPDVGVFRVMNRAVKDDIIQMREQTRIITGLIDWLGFNSDYIEVDRPARFAGKTKYSLKKMVRLALQGIMSFSNLPLRLATYFGFTMSLFSFFIGAYFLFKKLFYNYGLIGWPSLITAILFLGGVQLLVIGILGEYIGKIFIDVKQRPLYVISKKL